MTHLPNLLRVIGLGAKERCNASEASVASVGGESECGRGVVETYRGTAFRFYALQFRHS